MTIFQYRYEGIKIPSEGQYRFDYQGQFAERDEETGYSQFELRLWDSRIGRWQTIDPAGQYHSPYMGMGNNPVNLIDPDGGFLDGYTDENGNYIWFDDHTETSFIDAKGTEWTWVTVDKGAWMEAITIRDANISFLMEMGYEYDDLKRNVSLFSGDHEFFTKYSQLNDISIINDNALWHKASQSGGRPGKQTFLDINGYNLKFYYDKNAYKNVNTIGLVKASWYGHFEEAAWEKFDEKIGVDDLTKDMHFENSFIFLGNDWVNKMYMHTETYYRLGY